LKAPHLLLGDLPEGKERLLSLKLHMKRIGLLPLHVSAGRPVNAVHASDVKIAWIELPGSLQPLWVAQCHRPALQCDQPLAAKLLEGQVHVDGREAEGIRQFRLGHRKVIAAVLSKANHLEALPHFTQQMRDPGVGRALSEGHRQLNTFACSCRCLGPERAAHFQSLRPVAG
jgi:hypothetical protein